MQCDRNIDLRRAASLRIGERRTRAGATLVGMGRLGFVLVVPLSLAVLAGPRVADACQPDPCWGADQFRTFGSTQATVATDGVVAFEYERGIGMLEEAQALEYIDVLVSDDVGNVIPGALEAWATSGIALWRPSAPLPPDTALEVTVTVDNTSIAAATAPRLVGCNPDLAFDLPIVTGSTALPEIVTDGITPISEVVFAPNLNDLSGLVCCDGAYPSVPGLGDCGGGGGAQWLEGHCTATSGEARLDAGFEFAELLALDMDDDLLAIMVADAGWTVRSAIDEPSVTTWDTEPFCARLDVWSLARGTRVQTDEVCFGEDVADQLGPTGIDPSAELEAQCVGEPYTCEVQEGFGSSWNSRDCEPWTDSAGDSTGGDESGDAGDADGGTEGGSANETGTAQTDAGTADDGDDTTPSTASDGESSGSGGQDGATDRGCACSSDPQSDVSALGLLVLLALRRRRG